MTEYQGHKNRQYWNVALWLYNDEPTYRVVIDFLEGMGKHAPLRVVAKNIMLYLPERTPDGYKYTICNVAAAIQEDYENYEELYNE
jgi:hypothetical protein